MLRDFLISDGIGMTREYTTIFQLIFFCVTDRERSRYRDLVAGLLAGLIFFMQQDQVLFLIPFLVWSWMSTGPRSVPMRAARMIGRFGVVLGPLLLYLGLYACAGLLLGRCFSIQFLLVYDTEEVAWRSFQDHQANAGCGKLCASFPDLRYAWA